MEREAAARPDARPANVSPRSASRLATTGWLAMSALAALAYRALLAWSPQEGVPRPAEGVEGFLFEPSGEQPLLVVGLAVWLLWRRRGRLLAGAASPAATLAGALLLAASVAAAAWARFTAAPDLLIPSLQLLLLGAGALLGGTRGARAALPPALFLLLALPIPPVLLNQIFPSLQLGTVAATREVLELLGYEVVTFGDRIRTSWRLFQVIESCSGLRLMQTLVLAAIVYAELVSRRRSRLLLLLLAAPFVGALVNLGRVLAIVLSEAPTLHTTQGIVMVVIGVLLLVALDGLLERRSPHAAARRARAAAPRTPARRLLPVAGALAAIAALPLALAPWDVPDEPAANLHDLPHRIDGWRSRGLTVDRLFLGSVSFSDRSYRRFRARGEEVTVFIGVDDRRNRRGSLRSPKTAYPGTGWDVVGRDTLPLADGLDAELLELASPEGRLLVLHWYEGTASLADEALRSLLALDRSPLRRPGRARVFRLATPIATWAAAREEARERLLFLARRLRESLGALATRARATRAS